MKIVLATKNKGKIKEFKKVFSELGWEAVAISDIAYVKEPEETGKTFEENAKKKAKEIYEFLKNKGEKNFIVLSDDSGLEVDYLDGAPGVYSARYAGEHGNDSKNNEKLLESLNGVSKEKRGAQFVCQIAMFDENGKYYTVKGEVRGYILEQLNGEGGFGYDPLFFYEPLNKTFGMLNPEEKNEISHRGKALKELKSIISETIK